MVQLKGFSRKANIMFQIWGFQRQFIGRYLKFLDQTGYNEDADQIEQEIPADLDQHRSKTRGLNKLIDISVKRARDAKSMIQRFILITWSAVYPTPYTTPRVA